MIFIVSTCRELSKCIDQPMITNADMRNTRGKPGLVGHAQNKYIGETCVIKNVILTLLAWMSLHVKSQQATPSEVHARDFTLPALVAALLSNFQSWVERT